MVATAAIRISAALVCLPLLASAQPAIQSPPAAFQTPSGNVHCRFGAGALRCEVLERAYAAPRECPGGWQGGIALRAEGEIELPCEAPGLRNDEAFVLGYGARWLGPGITCESEEAGLRCANRAGRGFQASRSRLAVF
jgi:hypothetical protein